MHRLFIFDKTKLVAFASFFAYVVSIAIGAVKYLPYQTYAPGVFGTYSIDGVEFIVLPLIALLGVALLPKKIVWPSDWFLVIFVIFLLMPTLVLGVSSNNTSIENKLIIFPTFIGCISMLAAVRNIKIINFNYGKNITIKKNVLYAVFFVWVVLLIFLVVKYYSVMRFSGVDEIYFQRELTGDVSGLWGYVQLYFTFVFSTFLVAYGLSSGKWAWVVFGSFGYFTMYLITAEKAQLIFPLFFIAINYLVNTKKNPIKIISIAIASFAAIIFGVVWLGEEVKFFDLAGFYLFSRLIATPSQFILDYYDFFSENGYTFFSQIRGFDIFIDAPSVYASHPKWPQLGWIVGSGVHGIESNSNATFIAADGAASLGALGMVLVTLVLCIYLVFANGLSQKFSKSFWSIIFAQQAFTLVSGSLFSMLLSFGGFFYLMLFVFYKPKKIISAEVE